MGNGFFRSGKFGHNQRMIIPISTSISYKKVQYNLKTWTLFTSNKDHKNHPSLDPLISQLFQFDTFWNTLDPLYFWCIKMHTFNFWWSHLVIHWFLWDDVTELHGIVFSPHLTFPLTHHPNPTQADVLQS